VGQKTVKNTGGLLYLIDKESVVCPTKL